MSTLRDRLANPNYSIGSTAPVVNAPHGAQAGPQINVGRYVNNAHYVKRNTIVRVVEYPKWVNYMPNPQPWREAIKSWFETNTRVDGITFGLSAEFIRTDISAAGHQQADLSKVTEAQSSVTHTGTEKYGKYFRTMLNTWIRMGMADPISQVPLITLLNDNVRDALPDLYCASVLYIEPDPTHKFVQEAVLITNMAPENEGPVEMRKDWTASGETVELAIPFTGLQQVSYGVRQWAQELMDQMGRGGFNSFAQRSAIEAISADVQATRKGYVDLNEEFRASSINQAV